MNSWGCGRKPRPLLFLLVRFLLLLFLQQQQQQPGTGLGSSSSSASYPAAPAGAAKSLQAALLTDAQLVSGGLGSLQFNEARTWSGEKKAPAGLLLYKPKPLFPPPAFWSVESPAKCLLLLPPSLARSLSASSYFVFCVPNMTIRRLISA